MRHSSNWLIRLGDGTQESKGKVQKSLNNIWMFTGNLFEMDVLDSEMASAGIGVDNIALKSDWE